MSKKNKYGQLLNLHERLHMLEGASKLRVNVMHDSNVINESVNEVWCACFSRIDVPFDFECSYLIFSLDVCNKVMNE